MIIDRSLQPSVAQAITATAASSDYIDLTQARDFAKGEPIAPVVHIDEAFNTLTSLAIAVQVDDNTSFSSATTIATKSINLAQLTLNAWVIFEALAPGLLGATGEKYLRFYYTVTGSNPTLGKVTAGLSRLSDIPMNAGVVA